MKVGPSTPAEARPALARRGGTHSIPHRRRCFHPPAEAAGGRHLDGPGSGGRRGVWELDGLVANAGVLAMAPALELSDEGWERQFEVNVPGLFTC
ncbi:MAG: SDR family NAD(P)-dependent oxidoreductase [Gemmatimonadota bacterium]